MSTVVSTPFADPNVAILNSLQIEIKSAQDKLNKRLNEIGNLRIQTYTRILYYIIIVLSMMFFAYIILRDIYRVLKLHENNTNVIENTPKITEDEYDYSTNTNYARKLSSQILNTLDTSNQSIKTTFQPLLDFRERNKLDKTLYTRTNAHTLGPDDDSYKYDKKAGASFWSMLFEKPQYYSMVNADPRNSLNA